MRITYVIAILLLISESDCFGQLTVTSSSNALSMAQTLAGPGVNVSNATLTSASGMAGFFSGHTSVGIDSGIILTNGLITDAVGPNNYGSTSYNWMVNGDTDLANAIGVQVSHLYDNCALEFDLVANGDSLLFNYVFGSEEYPEYACSAFNDAFALFIKGPGITGYKNIAVIPGTDTAVSIKTINIGPGADNNGGVCAPVTYPQYYVSNGDGTNAPYDSDPYYVQYDGMTTVMNAAIGGLTMGGTYHLKVVIDDVGDGDLDSGVFLRSGMKFFSAACRVSTGNPYTSDSTSNIAVAGCSTGIIPIRLTSPATADTTVHFSISGSAVNGMDYTAIADSVTFLAGDSVENVIISPLASLYSGNKTVTITVPSACGGSLATLSITNKIKIAVSPHNVTICQGQSVNITATSASNHYVWTPAKGLSDSTISNPIATPATTTTYICTTFLNGCSASDTAQIIVIPYPHSIVFGVPYTSDSLSNTAVAQCSYGVIPVKLIPPALADTVVHFVVSGTAISGIDYSAIADSVTFNAGDSIAFVRVQPLSSLGSGVKTVTLAINAPCGPLTSSPLNIVNQFYLSVTPADTQICIGSGVQLFNNTNADKYKWAPANMLIDSTSANPVAKPNTTTTYTCTAYLGTCTLTDSVAIHVLDPCPVSVTDLIADNAQFEMFPNPATDVFTVKVLSGNAKGFDFNISNMEGQIVKELRNITGTETDIDITGLASGVYVITLRSNNATQSKQLVKF